MLFQADPRHTKQVIVTQLIVAALSIPVLAVFWEWQYLAYILGFYCFLLFVGHHAGLHRYFSHKSYSVNQFWHVFLCLTSCLVCFGSPAGYAVIHRAHHAHTDTEQDPHAGKYLGFANVIFFNWKLEHLTMWSAVRDLRDPWIKFTHDYYTLVLIVDALILFAVDPALVLCYSIGTALALFAMGFINTVCHTNGFMTYRNHQTRDSSSNSYLAVLIGEWHNNHHNDPRASSQREQWWEIDYAAQFIRLVKK